MGIIDKIKKGVEHVAEETVDEGKKAGEAIHKGIEHAANEMAEEGKKAGEAIGKGIKHAVLEFHETYIECHGSDKTSTDEQAESKEKSGVILIISGSGIGCGVTVNNIDTGKTGEHQDPDARSSFDCRNVCDVAFGQAGIESVCQITASELWVSTKYKWNAKHYGPSVTHKKTQEK